MDSVYYLKTAVNYALEGVLVNRKPRTENRELKLEHPKLLFYGSYKP